MCLLAILAALGDAPLAAQQVLPPQGPEDCAGAHSQLRLVADSLGAESGLPVVPIASRTTADDHLRRLTNLAEEGGGCVLTITVEAGSTTAERSTGIVIVEKADR